MGKKVIYISGPITGVPDYRLPFAAAAAELTKAGFIPLNPASLPEGMNKAQYMRIDLAMLDAADAILLLDGWERSRGAWIECNYAQYISKPHASNVAELKLIFGR